MSLRIVQAKPTTLRVPLEAAAATVKVRALVDIDGNEIVDADFGEFLVVVVKSGSKVEIIKCTAVTQLGGTDGANLTVATNGRSIAPNYPYAGAATGHDFQTGDVIVTNDPLTMSRFAQLDNANTWDETQTFTVPPVSATVPTSADHVANKAYVDSVVAGTAVYDQNIIPGTAGETLAAGDLVYFKESDGRWWKTDADAFATSLNVKLGFAQAAATAGVSVNILIGGLEKNLTGLTVGKYYVSGTAAGLSATPGANARFVGWAVSTTRFVLAPNELEENIELGTAGEILAADNWVYFKTSDQKWWKTDADAAATATGVRIGVVQEAASADGVVLVRVGGVNGTGTGLTAGAKYYLSGTAAAISSTQGANARLVGVAISTTRLAMVDTSNVFAVEQHGQQVYAATATGNDSYVVSLNPTLPALFNGLHLFIKLDVANTGAATLNVDGTGALALVTGLSTALVTGDYLANQIIEVVYNSTGTVWQVITPKSTLPQYVSGVVSDLVTTAEANNDVTVTTTFTPRRIKLFYFIQGHDQSTESNVYLGMKGIAIFDGTTLVANHIEWGQEGNGSALTADNGVPTALSAFYNLPNSTAAIVVGNNNTGGGGVSQIKLTLSISAVSSTGFTIRRLTATGEGASSSNARAKIMYEAFE